jgi:hypothetical protein
MRLMVSIARKVCTRKNVAQLASTRASSIVAIAAAVTLRPCVRR